MWLLFILEIIFTTNYDTLNVRLFSVFKPLTIQSCLPDLMIKNSKILLHIRNKLKTKVLKVYKKDIPSRTFYKITTCHKID